MWRLAKRCDALIGETRTLYVEEGKTTQSFEMLHRGIGDQGVTEIEMSQPREARELCDSAIGNSRPLNAKRS